VNGNAVLPWWQVMGSMYALLAWVTWVVHGRYLRGAASDMLYRQVTSWWRLLPWVTLACLGFPLGTWLLVGLIGLFVARELWHLLPTAAGHGRSAWLAIALLLAIVQALGVCLAPGWFVMSMGVTAVLMLGAWALTRLQGTLLASLFCLQAMALWTVSLWDQLPMDRSEQVSWFFLLMVITALNDIGQFVAGRLLGKRPLARRLSPNKTWEGAWGGVLLCTLLSVLVGRLLGLASLSFLAVLGLGISLSGIAGDLLFSAAKRRLGIKDFSTLIPGHGGMLDRVDSLVLTAPCLFLVLRFLPPQ
jgi:phosphatidate cytidylyltransferase